MVAVNRYDQELAKLPSTYEAAHTANIDRLKAAVAGACESSIIGVGTGGSFTVASLLCHLHETYTGRVSRPATSLEIICNPTLSAASPVFLISAEGKNPDIAEALLRARRHSARAIHVLTNHVPSPLTECIEQFTGITRHVFELPQKDGYLATNSLVFNSALVARVFSELDQEPGEVPPVISDLRVGEHTIDEWLTRSEAFAEKVVSRDNVIITYSPLLQPIAADLESKLSEAALVHCQVADLRSLAHGRHLWFAEREASCAVLALVEPSLGALWEHMRSLLPIGVPTCTMALASGKPRDLLAGLVAAMRFVSAVAKFQDRDPGGPNVPQFGRRLYYVDLPKFIPSPRDSGDLGEQAKYDTLGARWPSATRRGSMQRSLEVFRTTLQRQEFRAVVFDYDGTLCGSQRDEGQPPESIVAHLQRLLTAGVLVAIASGRGGSVQEQFQKCLPELYWPDVRLGLYSGGWITTISGGSRASGETSEFLSHVTRIVHRLKFLGVPIEQVRPTHPYQVSVRFREGLQTEGMWFVVADALRQAGIDLYRMVRSKHSVDILAPGIDKSRLIAHIIQETKVSPEQVLAIGDQGAWPGNDFSLLEHRFSLSVDVPSRRLDRGWKLAPPHKRDVDATLWYMERMQIVSPGCFQLSFDSPPPAAL
jgi:HAD superfamily hydrolase (TIGR01484 family)